MRRDALAATGCAPRRPAEACRSRAGGPAVIPAQAGTHTPCGAEFRAAYGSPPARRLRGDDSDASLLRGLHRVLDGVELLELHVVELAVNALDLADVDRLHDVARLRIDGDHAARALPAHALHGGDQRVAVGLAAGLLERLVD